MTVSVGLDVLLADHRSLVAGKRIGLLTNSSGISHRKRDRLRSNYLVLREQGVNLVALFSPEHGLAGAVADAEPVASGREPRTGLPLLGGEGWGEWRASRPSGIPRLVIV